MTTRFLGKCSLSENAYGMIAMVTTMAMIAIMAMMTTMAMMAMMALMALTHRPWKNRSTTYGFDPEAIFTFGKCTASSTTVERFSKLGK